MINIRKHLETLDIEVSEIDNIIDIIRKYGEFAKLIKGEPADVVDEDDKKIGVTEIGLCHYLGLRHRTANAIVLTKEGKVLLQLRAPGRKYELFLSIFGGHLKAGQEYEEAMRDELRQELHLDDLPKGILTEIGKESYEVIGDKNVEFRKLYTHKITDAEYRQVEDRIDIIENKKRKLVEKHGIEQAKKFFSEWLKSDERRDQGLGEVWGYYGVNPKDITNADHETISVKDDDYKNIELHYLIISDVILGPNFKGFFTPDLLDRIVNEFSKI